MKTLINLLVLTLCLTKVKRIESSEWVPLKGNIKIKKGVVKKCYGELDMFLNDFANDFDVTLYVTEAMDTINRTNNSFHKIPCGARDIRVWNLHYKVRIALIVEARKAGFFAIDEKDHIHIDIGGMKSKEDRLKILEKHK